MKLAPKPALAAAALALAAAVAPAQTQQDSGAPAPAPVVRPRPRPANPATGTPTSSYQDAFPALRSSPNGATGAAVAPRRTPTQTGSTGTTAPRVPRPASGYTGSTYPRTASGSTGSAGTRTATGSTGTTAPRTAHTAASGATGIPSGLATATPKPSAAATPPAAPIATSTTLNRTTIVLDPGHGGSDNGSRIADNLVEKDVTLAFAFKLRSLLQARGFTVILTRDEQSSANDAPPAPLSLDDRAGIANHARAVACLLIHATGAGTGVHLYHSDLSAAPGEAATLPWLTAQAAWVGQSSALANQLAQSLTRSGLAVVNSAASVRPVDSLTCPALVVELAPKSSGDPSGLTSDSYGNSAAQAIAGALVFWKEQAKAPERLQLKPTETGLSTTKSSPAKSATGATGTTAPKPKPRPAPTTPTEDRND